MRSLYCFSRRILSTSSADCFCDLPINVKTELFEKHLSTESLSDKAKVGGYVDLLDHCFADYVDSRTGKRNLTFPLGQLVLLYGFLQYVLHFDAITDEQFNERIRIVNNLVINSQDEMHDSEDRVGGNRLPAILEQTKSIITEGKIIFKENFNNFNVNQLNEEKEKQQWRLDNPDKVADLNMLENNDLLQGQVSIVGLENSDVFSRFTDTFNCDRDLVSCALLTFGDYSRVEKGWRYTFGTKSNDAPWKFIFHKSAGAEGFEKTKNVLVALLRSNDHIDNDYLKSLKENYIANCEANSLFDWRYYFIKYDVFRPDRYGKYWIKDNNYYEIYAMVTQSKLSEYAYQPFLKVVDSDHLDKANTGQRLKYDNRYVYCEGNAFVIKDENDEVVETISIEQNEDGIDTENRIEKYISTPKSL